MLLGSEKKLLLWSVVDTLRQLTGRSLAHFFDSLDPVESTTVSETKHRWIKICRPCSFDTVHEASCMMANKRYTACVFVENRCS